MKKNIIAISTLVLMSLAMNAQDLKMPVASPNVKYSQEFSTSKIELDYNRPAVKGRKIFGDLIPFGKLWRTGANSSSKITFGESVTINNTQIPAGTYSLYTIPNQNSWVVILNKGLDNWGLTGYNQSEDVVRFEVPAVKSAIFYENFTIDINNITNNSSTITLAWENTSVSFNVQANNKERILTYLDNALKGDKPPYQQAANYYLEQNHDLPKAITYVDKAIETNQSAFWLYWLKAKIYAKMGKKKEAIEAATKSATLSKGSDYETEYVNNLNNLKKELK